MSDPERSLADALRERIERTHHGATVDVSDRGGGHFAIEVTWAGFAEMKTLARQRSVYGAITDLMQGERAPVHAIDQMVTRTPEG